MKLLRRIRFGAATLLCIISGAGMLLAQTPGTPVEDRLAKIEAATSVAQAAVRLGIAPGTVKSRSHYALRAMRLAIDEMGGLA